MLTACGKNSKHVSETLYGQVQSVDGTKLTLLLGTVSEMTAPSRSEGMEGESADQGFTQFGSADTDGEAASSQNSDNAEDNQAENENETQAPQEDERTDGQPPQGENGERPQGGAAPEDGRSFPSGERPENLSMLSFTAGEETVTINSGEINAKAGDILKLVYDEKGKVSSVEVAKNVMDLSSMNRGGFGGFGEAPTGEGFKPGDKIGSGTTDGAIDSKKS